MAAIMTRKNSSGDKSTPYEDGGNGGGVGWMREPVGACSIT